MTSASNFANVNNEGNANNNNASNTWVGVRPDFDGTDKTCLKRQVPQRKERLSLRELNNSALYAEPLISVCLMRSDTSEPLSEA